MLLFFSSTTGAGTTRARRVVLADETIEIALPHLGHLRVTRFLVVAGAAGKEAGAGMLRPRQRAIGDAVLVDVAITSPRLHRSEIVGAEHLAAVERFLRIAQRRRQPRVHPKIQIAQHEDRRLKAFREIERLHRELVCLGDRRRQQHECFVSPCESVYANETSPCIVRVGRPVDGPARCTSKITPGTSAK